ncbi:MAG: NAD(P)H-hydrate epimerase [Melioribacteraceae bacterium]|nr:NAD(P)H-hydrate epimerase [Melioribacteraceae bacterium]MCF8263060.1 NAD(P)H-hydrate epimerase [Melioribacteraceae bacterium]MCF8413847.1 NAD(P)H-hydrate epimerase [Melioribacteraceae bacterium]MCF8431248.1 NAD(P)H-hydrate epimerase [Melioribacteraceae bacterium]
MYPNSIPHITADEMREIDRMMVEDFHIDLVQMMENAGRALARLSSDEFLNSQPSGKSVAVLAGKGGNGGGALSCARRLSNFGANVHVYLSEDKSEYKGIPLKQLNILEKLGVKICESCKENDFDNYDLIVDGLIGYSLKGSPKNLPADMIIQTNTSISAVVSLDIPSGIDPSTGEIFEPSVIADATLTLALPKKAFLVDATKEFVGKLYLADISVPPQLYSKPPFNYNVDNIFGGSDVIRLR